ncbi:MAG: hypothetical protein A3F10_01290 [Coxiella sp. RIFCSPHIGHO2_12_FULL_42_15]|nr:MAG: hypothetical protein A3F10_01290 [Coxiella sp. RIFCSPHIGHO2_12_FULL_42_15]
MNHQHLIELPAPSPDARQHSERLQAIILDEIENALGHISFEKFMQMALYYPGLGYYRSGAKKFGKGGDFVTAPELSPLFSHCVARQIQQVLQHDSAGCILEVGAGSGVMALEILRELERRKTLPDCYYILEVSAELRDRQYKLIAEQAPHFIERLQWLEALPTSPISGVIVANEVLDAMPVHKFKIENGIKEFYVGCKEAQFHWSVGLPSHTKLIDAIENLAVKFPQGYESEINLLLTPWIKSLAAVLQKGVLLLMDYGFVRAEYYHPERSMGTLLCHYQQRAHDDPLIFPGIQDITANVDFTAIALAGEKAGLDVAGFTHQAAFLMNCGLMEFATQNVDYRDHYLLAQQIKRLTLPSEMGERFKAIALGKNFSDALIGFQQFDQTGRL